ncbi:MAG: glutamate-1-semialdehyde 2,1-aminomutase [Sandaracinaceae bacterium]|nr:glutamate-1-semialdehyde 2,1-aminomutase [Myxococcales bacterium]MCB9658560.1 glutamate-1-semialdehyde 2,1-aminomutase [Sandaracinaceae bacterium]
MTDATSKALFAAAQQRIPGGVNSPVRAFRAVGGEPVFVQRANGPFLYGADGTAYVDYVGSWGPMILGHAQPDVVTAIQEAATLGCSYGAPTAGETDMAEAIADAFPSMEMTRLVSSGTEATMGALRVARGFTGRDLVVKCVGGYHGGADYLLVKAGSGLATLGEPDSGGVPASIAATTRLVEYNDVDGLRALFAAEGAQIAAVIIEPVAGNMGCVPPDPEWLAALRTETLEHGALLIFDEVMTGFRVARGGAQALYGITPDLTCLGKIVGGGLPVGAYGGRREIMSKIAPLGPVYQAGTLSGNPLAVAAGLTTLGLLREPGLYEGLEAASASLEAGLVQAAADAGVVARVQRVGSMLTVFFTDAPVRDWPSADRCDRRAFGAFHASLLAHGVYWPPSQFEAAFVSTAHDAEVLATTLRAAQQAFKAVRAQSASE